MQVGFEMANSWWPLRPFGKNPSSHTDFLHISRSNIERISELTSLSEPLNPHQCRSMSWKLERTIRSVQHIVDSVDDMSLLTGSAALENFYRVSEKGRQLVEDCCRPDWWQASAFQIQNEEAFKEILLEAGLSYNTIFQVVGDVHKKKRKEFLCEDLRETAMFDPSGADEVLKDRLALKERLNGLLNDANFSTRSQLLGQYLLGRVTYVLQHSPDEDRDVRYFNQWADGEGPDDELGAADFLGGNVCKTSWLDVPCARKVFEDEAEEEVWLAEAKILASLNHPNIVKFLCCNKYTTTHCTGHFIAMEQMETSLATFIKRLRKDGGKPSLFLAVDVILQIAHGLCYMHDHGVGHRDLKTSNVVVRKVTSPHLQYNLEVKLADFGISKVKLKAGKSNTITRPKIGTTVYMPPEAFTNGRADWLKADVYSFSVMCSVILSCHEPFQHVKRSDLYGVICSGERPELPGDTPKELADVIKEGWATDRKLRPSILDICSRLEKLRDGLLRDHGTWSHVRHVDSRGSNSYIERRLRKRFETRERDWSHDACLQTLMNGMDEEEWFDGDEEQETIVEVHQTTLQHEERHGASTRGEAEECTIPRITERSYSGGDRLTDRFIIAPHQDASEEPVFSGFPDSNDLLLSMSRGEADSVPVGRNHGRGVRDNAVMAKGAAGWSGGHPSAGTLVTQCTNRGITVLMELAKDFESTEETRRTASQLLQSLVQLGETEVGAQDQKTVLPNLCVSDEFVKTFNLFSLKQSLIEHFPSERRQLLQWLVKEFLSENWTYGIFWKLAHSPSGDSILDWGDGYYKGPSDDDFIKPKHTQTAQHQELKMIALRELQSLVSSPVEVTTEDVLDTEWFYLVSMAHSFAEGVGIPGHALKSGHPVWLQKEDKASNQVCTRAHLAKVAGIQTILCVQVLGGVVELGSTDLFCCRQ